jgi:hypothetical protein
LVLTIGKHTCESKGNKQVHVLKVEDKMQITIVNYSFVNGILHWFQIIFIRTMSKTLPPITKGKQHACQIFGLWDLTHVENQWFNLQTTKHFVKKIMIPHFRYQIQALKLQKH